MSNTKSTKGTTKGRHRPIHKEKTSRRRPIRGVTPLVGQPFEVRERKGVSERVRSVLQAVGLMLLRDLLRAVFDHLSKGR